MYFAVPTAHMELPSSKKYQYLSYPCLIPEEEEVIHFGYCARKELAGFPDWMTPGPYRNYTFTDLVSSLALDCLSMSTSFSRRDQPRDIIHTRSHTLPYIERLIKATHVRHLRQHSSFMFPQPRYPGDLSAAETSLSADRRIGAPQCHACVSNPSHRLLPCQHTVCYDHFLAHPEGASLRCARCLKVRIIYPTIYIVS